MSVEALMIFAMIAVSCGLGLALYLGDSGKRRISRRARGRRRNAEPSARARAVSLGSNLRRDNDGRLDTVIRRLAPRPDALRARLTATGRGMTMGGYGIASAVVAVVVLALCLLRGVAPLLALMIGAFAGLWLPHMYVGSLIKSRQKKFVKLFPDAIGLMVRGLKAGLPVGETILVTGREVADPVGEEFRRIGEQVKLGQSIEDAMWGTARRLNLADFNFLVISFSVQRETGGNLAETLENLQEILRKREQMKLKIKAMSSEATASAGIIGCLPFVVGGAMFVVSKTYILTLFHSTLGYTMLAGGGAMLAMGIFVMVRMVSFDI